MPRTSGIIVRGGSETLSGVRVRSGRLLEESDVCAAEAVVPWRAPESIGQRLRIRVCVQEV